MKAVSARWAEKGDREFESEADGENMKPVYGEGIACEGRSVRLSVADVCRCLFCGAA